MPNRKAKSQTKEFVGAIDQGTSSSRFLVGFENKNIEIKRIIFYSKRFLIAANLDLVTYHQESIEILAPKPGWVEQDPNEILDKTVLCMEKAVEKFEGLGYNKSDIKGKKQQNSKSNIFFALF